MFKDIPGFPHYQINEIGEVYSLYSKRLLKPQINNSGYLVVDLHEGSKRNIKLIHRLVAETFLENDNPVEKTQINHKDENKLNNVISNLEWVTPSYNNNYGTKNQRCAEKNSRPVDQFTLDNQFIRSWSSANEAERYYNMGHGAVTHCCAKDSKTACGYIWKYHQE